MVLLKSRGIEDCNMVMERVRLEFKRETIRFVRTRARVVVAPMLEVLIDENLELWSARKTDRETWTVRGGGEGNFQKSLRLSKSENGERAPRVLKTQILGENSRAN